MRGPDQEKLRGQLEELFRHSTVPPWVYGDLSAAANRPEPQGDEGEAIDPPLKEEPLSGA